MPLRRLGHTSRDGEIPVVYFDFYFVLAKAWEFEFGNDKVILGVLKNVQPKRGMWLIYQCVRGCARCAYEV